MSEYKLILTGEKMKILLNKAEQAGAERSKIYCFGKMGAEKVVENILGMIKKPSLIYAMGNMGGGGGEIVNYFDSLYQREQEVKSD